MKTTNRRKRAFTARRETTAECVTALPVEVIRNSEAKCFLVAAVVTMACYVTTVNSPREKAIEYNKIAMQRIL